MRFENQGIIVTGGGSGIGRETAIEFAKEGATVILQTPAASAEGAPVEAATDAKQAPVPVAAG